MIRITWARACALRGRGLCGKGIDRAVDLLGVTPNRRSWVTLARLLDVGLDLGDVVRTLVLIRPDLARLWAADCAERALLRERARGREADERSWAAVAAARAFAREEIDTVALAVAWDEAWYTFGVASLDAARAAARDVVWDAARDAATYAAWAADCWYLEHKWQRARLRWYVSGQVGDPGWIWEGRP